MRTCGSFFKVTRVSSVKWEETSSAEMRMRKEVFGFSGEKSYRELSSGVEELMK